MIVSSFHKLPLSPLLLILLYNISFVYVWPPGSFFRLCTVRPSLYNISMSEICLSFQNIETMKPNVFITVIVMRYHPWSFHMPDFFLNANIDYLAFAIRFLSKQAVFLQKCRNFRLFCDRFYRNIKLNLRFFHNAIFFFRKSQNFVLWHYLKLKNTTFFSCRFSENFIFSAVPGIWRNIFTGWFIKCSDVVFFLSGVNLSNFLPLNPAKYSIGNAPNIMFPRCKEQDECHSHFTFYCKLSKISLDCISELR